MLRYRHAYRAWDGLCNDEWISMSVSGAVT
jgi:hypothetical protein